MTMKTTQSLNNVCLDASLWIRWLTPEAGTNDMKNLMSLWMDEYNFFIAPSLLVFEVTSALRKKFRFGHIPLKSVHEGLKAFYDLPMILVQSESLLAGTYEWAQRLEETVIYDASYLALATMHRVPLLTGDQKFYEKAKKFYADIRLV